MKILVFDGPAGDPGTASPPAAPAAAAAAEPEGCVVSCISIGFISWGPMKTYQFCADNLSARVPGCEPEADRERQHLLTGSLVCSRRCSIKLRCRVSGFNLPLPSDKGTPSRFEVVFPDSQDQILVLTVLTIYVAFAIDSGQGLDRAVPGRLRV